MKTTGGSTTGSDNLSTSSSTDGGGRIKGAAGSAKSRASDAYSASRERTSAAVGNVRDRASGVVSTGRQQIDSNPMIAIAGGLAVGAVLGALLPRTQREKEVLGGVGTKVTDAARDAANSAVEAGRQQVNEITHNAMAKVGEAVVGAVTSSEPANAQAQ